MFLSSSPPCWNESGNPPHELVKSTDLHINDPLGGFLTTAELAEQDRTVFSVANEIGIPVVWNLAGGYQHPLENVLEIDRNTMAACINEYVINVPTHFNMSQLS